MSESTSVIQLLDEIAKSGYSVGEGFISVSVDRLCLQGLHEDFIHDVIVKTDDGRLIFGLIPAGFGLPDLVAAGLPEASVVMVMQPLSKEFARPY